MTRIADLRENCLRWLAPWLYRLNRLRWAITRPVTLGVRLLLIRDDTVILVRHTYQPHAYLPGGGVKRGETLEQATRREAAEEVGAVLGDLRLFGVYTNFYEHKSDHVAVFLCSDFVLNPSASPEIAGILRANVHDLPETISPGSRRRILEYLAGNRPASARLW